MGYVKSLLSAVSLLIGGLFPVQVSAQANNTDVGKFISVDQSVGLIKNVFLLVDDQVSGGCWGNSQKVREHVKESLEQAGIRVYDEPLLIMSPLSSNLLITAQGSRQGGCFGSIRMESYRSVISNFEGSKVESRAYNFIQGSMARNRRNLDNDFLDAATEHTSALITKIAESRRNSVVAKAFEQASAKEAAPLPLRALADIFREPGGAAGDKGLAGSR